MKSSDICLASWTKLVSRRKTLILPLVISGAIGHDGDGFIIASDVCNFWDFCDWGGFMSDLLFSVATAPCLPVEGEAGLFPIARIFCVGRNYAAHAAEMGVAVDREAPFYFTVNPVNAVLGGEVATPTGTSDYHHEVEFVVALSGGGVSIPREKAEECIYGYGVGLDMTRRDLQNTAKQARRPWCLSKDCEGGTVLSSLIKASAFGAIADQEISLTKNGTMVQRSDLSYMVYQVPDLIAHLSQFYCLAAGDIIMTGTPEGVGPVAVGDRLVAQVEGVPSLEVVFV